MSAALIPATDVAYNELFARVHSPVFFQKLAAAGIVPSNDVEVQQLLDLAGTIRDFEGKTSAKTAAASSPYSAPIAALNQLLTSQGLDGGIKQAAAREQDAALQNFTEAVIADPLVYNSVLRLKSDEAEAVREKFATANA